MAALNPKDLWIGDLIRRKSDGLIYRYDGMGPDGSLMVRRGRKKLMLSPNEFGSEVIDPEEHESQLFARQSERQSKVFQRKQTSVPDEIDLHITPENENKIGNWPGAELHWQKQKCRDYLQSAIYQGFSSVLIIHGKGEGILKAEVVHILESYAEVMSWNAEHEGALRVHLKP